MRAVGYVRVSTAEQAQDGVSLAMQAEKIAKWAELNDAELVETVVDEGVSAKSTDRPGLARVLELAKAHRAAVVVYSLSRLSRSTSDTLRLLAEIERFGGELVSLTERVDTTSPGGRMLFRLTAVLAEFEREQLAERTRDAMRHAKAQGRVVGSVPHGFRREGDVLVLNPDEQKVIELVRSLRAKGHSLRAISDALAERGVFNRAGRKFNPNSIRSMLAA